MDMIQHNQILYRDLLDPVKLLYGKSETELSQFWPYVRKDGEKKKISTKVSSEYSKLMQTSQRLVADQTLQAYSFKGVKKNSGYWRWYGRIFISGKKQVSRHPSNRF